MGMSSYSINFCIWIVLRLNWAVCPLLLPCCRKNGSTNARGSLFDALNKVVNIYWVHWKRLQRAPQDPLRRQGKKTSPSSIGWQRWYGRGGYRQDQSPWSNGNGGAGCQSRYPQKLLEPYWNTAPTTPQNHAETPPPFYGSKPCSGLGHYHPVCNRTALRKVYVVIFTACGDFCGGFHHKSKSPHILVVVFTTSPNHHKYLWQKLPQVQITTNPVATSICGHDFFLSLHTYHQLYM